MGCLKLLRLRPLRCVLQQSSLNTVDLIYCCYCCSSPKLVSTEFR